MLSVVVITRNEAHNLPRLLDAVKDLADEVVVIREVSSEIEVRRVDARGHHLRLEDIQV